MHLLKPFFTIKICQAYMVNFFCNFKQFLKDEWSLILLEPWRVCTFFVRKSDGLITNINFLKKFKILLLSLNYKESGMSATTIRGKRFAKIEPQYSHFIQQIFGALKAGSQLPLNSISTDFSTKQFRCKPFIIRPNDTEILGTILGSAFYYNSTRRPRNILT